MLGTGYQQEVALEKLYMDVAEYNQMIHVPSAGPDARGPGRAPRPGPADVARTSRCPPTSRWPTPTPNPWDAPAPAVIKPTAPIFLPPPGIPRAEDLERRHDVLERWRARSSCWSAPAPSAPGTRSWTSADVLGSPIVKTLPGKAVVPDDHPLTIGGIGLLGHRAVRRGDGDVRHPVHGRDQLPVHQVPARARPGHGGPDRGRSRPGRQPHRHRCPADRRRQGVPGRACPAPRAPGGPSVPRRRRRRPWPDGGSGWRRSRRSTAIRSNPSTSCARSTGWPPTMPS